MRSPRWQKVGRDLWLHKSRTALVVSAICIGIIGAGAVLNAWSLLRRATRLEFDGSNPASAVLRTDSVNAALLSRVRAMPAIANAQAQRITVASARTQEGWRTALLMARDDFATNAIGAIKPDHGAWPPDPDQVIVEHSSVEFAGIAVGDSLEIQVGDGPSATLRVGGVARDVGLAPGWMEHVVYIFVAPATLARLGVDSSMSELSIVVRDKSLDRAGVQRVANDVRTVVEASGRRVADVNVPVPGRHIHAGQIDSLLYTQGAFALLALLLSGVLVVNLVSAMLTGQVREIGVMKAMGARDGQIARMYLALALVLGVVACIISIPIALVLGRLYAEFTASILNFDVSAFTIPWWSFALQIGVGLVMPVVAAAVPIARGCRISVSDALRDLGIAGGGDAVPAGLLSRAGGLSRPVLLSLRNAFRRRQRMALTLATLSIGGAVYLGALNLRAAVIGSVDLLFEANRFDMVVRFAQPHSADSIVATMRALPGVAAVEAWSGARAAVSTVEGPLGNTFPITAPPAATTLLKARVDRGHWLQAGANELVTNRRLIEEDPSLDVGREVTLVIGGRPSRWRVVGAAETGPSAMAYASREALAATTGRAGATSAVVAASVGGAASQLELLRRLRGDLQDLGFEVSSTQSMTQQRAIVEDHLLMVAGFLGNMSLLMIVVGGLGLASTMSLAVLERTREIGVMRAIGARHGSILAMVQIEGLVISGLSWALALPLSIPMSVALGIAFGRVMLKVPMILLPNAAGVLQWLGVVVVLSLIACAWPAVRATRITTAAARAYE